MWAWGIVGHKLLMSMWERWPVIIKTTWTDFKSSVPTKNLYKNDNF